MGVVENCSARFESYERCRDLAGQRDTMKDKGRLKSLGATQLPFFVVGLSETCWACLDPNKNNRGLMGQREVTMTIQGRWKEGKSQNVTKRPVSANIQRVQAQISDRCLRISSPTTCRSCLQPFARNTGLADKRKMTKDEGNR